MKFTWMRPLIDGDRAAFFWLLSGTVEGPFFGVRVPGAKVEINGAAIYTFRDGQLVFVQHLFDFSAVLMKAGVLKVKPT
jgi:predicted ester cyclase